MQTVDLPVPSSEEIKHSEQLTAIIEQAIKDAGGWIDFQQYMQLALYFPGLGYYSGGAQKFGESGDFITAPEVSPLFAQSLARPVAALLGKITDANIIEFGAGSGKLAADLLLALQSLNQLPVAYFIIELSAELQQRQRETIQKMAPNLIEKVHWLTSLPDEQLNGVVIANEVLDAMPVQRFCIKGDEIKLLGVELVEGALSLKYRLASDEWLEKIKNLQIDFDVKDQGYTSEINAHISPWIKSLSRCLDKGGVYLIDYGYPRSEYYSQDRHMGTFLGYYRHRSIDAPLWYPGLQDLTAFVDFTQVAESALENGFDVDGFTSQGNFLLDCGLAQMVETAQTETQIQRLQMVQQMKTLSLPGEMGERFKVIGLSKGLDENIPGFGLRDFRYRL